MKITYDLEILPERKAPRRRSEEVIALISFLATNKKNMCFEYDAAEVWTRNCSAWQSNWQD